MGVIIAVYNCVRKTIQWVIRGIRFAANAVGNAVKAAINKVFSKVGVEIELEILDLN